MSILTINKGFCFIMDYWVSGVQNLPVNVQISQMWQTTVMDWQKKWKFIKKNNFQHAEILFVLNLYSSPSVQ